jgi:selenide,water dikinase
MSTSTIRLTQFSPGAGCGCKISPADLQNIIRELKDQPANGRLLVGCESFDDAAVYDLENGKAVISTTDFFTPIVDDPYDFGRIAAANALSDVYAMGGTPLMAVSILGWPLDKLPAGMASAVMQGAAYTCKLAGISLAGGHSIDISDPVFGLAVTGVAETGHIKRNSTGRAGCRLYLSKPLGMGILSTAAKKNVLSDEDYRQAVHWMTELNTAGIAFGRMESVRAMTDITGFGLLGHLLEICTGSNLGAIINFDHVPLVDNLANYITKNCIPGGTYRNWKSYGQRISTLSEFRKLVLADPQTSGGLLVAVDSDSTELDHFIRESNLVQIGQLVERRADGIDIQVI